MSESEIHSLLMAVGISIYILPAVIAYQRRHYNKGIIIALTLLFGWTGIGWVVLMLYASFSRSTQDPADDGFR
jgi:hypothetical protein